MTRALAIATLTIWAALAVQAVAQQRTIRDASGNTVATVSTDSAGNQTIRNARGKTVATVSPGRRR